MIGTFFLHLFLLGIENALHSYACIFIPIIYSSSSTFHSFDSIDNCYRSSYTYKCFIYFASRLPRFDNAHAIRRLIFSLLNINETYDLQTVNTHDSSQDNFVSHCLLWPQTLLIKNLKKLIQLNFSRIFVKYIYFLFSLRATVAKEIFNSAAISYLRCLCYNSKLNDLKLAFSSYINLFRTFQACFISHVMIC